MHSFIDLEVDDIAKLLFDVDFVGESETCEAGSDAYHSQLSGRAKRIRVERYFEWRVHADWLR